MFMSLCLFIIWCLFTISQDLINHLQIAIYKWYYFILFHWLYSPLFFWIIFVFIKFLSTHSCLFILVFSFVPLMIFLFSLLNTSCLWFYMPAKWISPWYLAVFSVQRYPSDLPELCWFLWHLRWLFVVWTLLGTVSIVKDFHSDRERTQIYGTFKVKSSVEG